MNSKYRCHGRSWMSKYVTNPINPPSNTGVGLYNSICHCFTSREVQSKDGKDVCSICNKIVIPITTFQVGSYPVGINSIISSSIYKPVINLYY